MAYAATISIKRQSVAGRRHYIVTITETDAAASSEVELLDGSTPETELPQIGTVMHCKTTLTAGTGTTVDPKLGTATGWTIDTQDAIWANGAAAAHINAKPLTHYNGSLFWSPVPNDATADHAISTELWIVEGLAPI